MVELCDATADRWDDVVTVMGVRGDPARCWCQYFRMPNRAWWDASPEQLRAALHRQVTDGPRPPGVLAYLDGTPAGWCGLAPRRSYERLERSRVASAVPDHDGLWAITCFVVRVGYRRRGVAGALLDGAVSLAQRHGATVVEGYPVDTTVKKSHSAELYHGTLALFTRAGFAEVARPSAYRPVVRRAL